jgi:CitMHS family citrate-Mg2+:H+ or citrate-Ca2+:H+ symporter
MLVALGLLMVVTFMFLIITKRATPVVALILVPVAFGLFAGAGLGISDMITDGIKDLAPTAAMLFFAIVFFGIMIDVGLFDPVVRGVVKLVRDDPAKLVVGTAVLAMVVSLDGDGSTTFIITTSALLPLYLKLGVSPVVLTVVAGLSNATMNIVPWGGPTARAASALKISPSEVFVPMIPSLVVGLVIVLLFAYHLGVLERRRIGRIEIRESVLARSGGGTGSGVAVLDGPGTGTVPAKRLSGSADIALDGPDSTDAKDDAPAPTFTEGTLDPTRETLRPKLLWFNAALTIGLLAVLGMDVISIPVLFMIAAGIALVVNFPKVKDQSAAITRHSSSIVAVVSMVLAAAVLTGVFSGTGMVEAIADWLTSILPTFLGPHLAIVIGLLSIPFTFFMTNDAFYFGMLPVLSETAQKYGIDPAEVARASITGQPVHMQSPLVPAILLLVALAGVSLADHHKKVLWRACLVSVAMLGTGVLVGSIPF